MKRDQPIKYTSDEDRQEANKKNKTKYMLNKQYTCETCNYKSSLAAKHMHLKTKKHITNTILKAIDVDDRFELITNDEQI